MSNLCLGVLLWVYCCRDVTNADQRGAFNHHLPHQDECETLHVIRRIYHVYRRTQQGVTYQVHFRPIALLLGWTSPTIPPCPHTGRPTGQL
ncbi:hypothetical protein V8E52_008955 [Russula decolorans]